MGPMACAALAVGIGLGACSPGADDAGAGEEVVDRRARRVVSLIPAATEILFALGAGNRLVGRTRWGVHPPEAVGVPDVGDGIRPSLEAVIARSPDLVVLFEGPDNEGVAARLADLGVASLSLRHNSLADLRRNVVALGEAVGCPAAAAALDARIAADLGAVAEATRGVDRVRVYYDVWADPPMTIGRGSFLDSLIALAGGRNVFGHLERPSPRVGLEAIVAGDPDVIVRPIRADAVDDAPLGERAGWETIRAVATNRIVYIDADLLGRLGPRVGEAALGLAAALHPELRLPSLPPPERLACPG